MAGNKKRAADAVVKALVCATCALFFLLGWLWKQEPSAEWQPPELHRERIELKQGHALVAAFLADVQAGRLDAAYASYTAVYNKDMGREAFKAYVRRQPRLKQPIPDFQGYVCESPPYGTYSYECRTQSLDGKPVRVWVMLSSTEGLLGIYSFGVEDSTSK